MTTRDYFWVRLLSGRRGLTIQEKEAILKRVLYTVSGQENTGAWSRIATMHPGFRIAACAAGLLAVVSVIVFLYRGADPGEFTVKGDDRLPSRFRITCLQTSDQTTCPQGGKLAFELHPPAGQLFFSAFARREKDGLVVWYFPSSTAQTSYRIPTAQPEHVMSQGVQIGAEHEPGQYEIYGVFSRQALSRAEIRQRLEEAPETARRDWTISHVKLEVSP